MTNNINLMELKLKIIESKANHPERLLYVNGQIDSKSLGAETIFVGIFDMNSF
jgi:hypothetical protein